MTNAIDNLVIAGWFFIPLAPVLIVGTVAAVCNAIINREK